MNVQKVFLEDTNIRRIFHLADIHIRLFRRQEEYAAQFERLYAELAHLTDDDIIIVAGDIVHTKTDVSPEMIRLVSSLFLKLSERAHTFVIAGNHDFLEKNASRLDALTPIIEALELPRLHYLKDSGVYQIGQMDVAVYSLLDGEQHWPSADDCTRSPKLALFHGPIYSATTDAGFTITSRHHELSMFDGFDMVMLGDIHKMSTLQSYSTEELEIDESDLHKYETDGWRVK